MTYKKTVYALGAVAAFAAAALVRSCVNAPDIAMDPLAEAQETVESNMNKPCGKEMAARSPVLTAHKGMECPEP